VLVAVTAAAIWSQRRLRDEPVERLAISRLTSSGRAVLATLSSDGKHLAYVLDGPEGRSLRIQQVATGSEAEVRAPVAADYWGLTISPDSAYLYFVSWNRNTPDAALYRLPVLGGAPQLLIDNVGGPISFSPDGGRFAFVREHDERGNSRLMIASLQELRPQTLLTLKDRWSMSTAMSGPAWSPDGRTIAVWIGNPNARHGVRERTLVAVDVADGSTRPVGTRSWFNVGRSVWGPEGDRLLFTASDQPSHPRQIWSLAFPSGAARQLTIDLNDYGSVSSIESGATAVAAVRTEVVHELWVENARAEPMLLVSQVGNYLGTEGFCWTPNGQIVYRALGSEGLDLWVADLQTGDRAQLTAESGNNFQPVVSPDGQYIVFTSERTGQTNIWRMDIDASDVRQLTFGREDARPRISPDGRWVVYQQGNSDGIRITLWKVSIDGGSPIRLTPSQSSHAIRPAISSDGRWVAYYYMDRESWGIATMPFEGGEPTRKFWIPPTARERVVRWTPDASGLAYVKENEGLSELWVQPLGAGPPQYLRSFPAGHVSVFEWSPDGQRLAWIRSNATSDVVRIELH
jgi:Tol biopolymer transport system component